MAAKRNLEIGRLLIAVYGLFALSASARAVFQIIRHFSDAPLAYLLSALSALVYIVATVSLAGKSQRSMRIARATVWFELIGVVVVGSLSLIVPSLFQHPTVWSEFGIGYGFVPLILPILGLLWLRKRSH